MPAPRAHRPPAARPVSPARLLLLLATLPIGCGEGAAGEPAPAAAPAERPADAPASSGSGLVILPAERSEPGPPAASELDRPYFHSFGRVPSGEVVTHVFRLENTDPEPVTVASIKPGCGCTVPSLRYRTPDGELVNGRPRTPESGGDEPLIVVPPGAVLEVSLAVDTRNIATKNADKTVQTTITTDSPNGYYVKLETHIVVEVPFHLVPNGIHFRRVPTSAGGRGSIEIVRAPGYEHLLHEVTRAPENVVAELAPKAAPGQPAWELSATLMGPLEEGRWNGELEIATRHPDGQPGDPVIVPLQADVMPDLVASPGRLVFVANDRESAGESVFSSLLHGHRFTIEAVELPAEHDALLEVSFEPESPDPRGACGVWIVRLRASDPDAIGDMLRGDLVLRLDDQAHPEARIPYVVHPSSRR